MAGDAIFDEDWREWISTVRRQVGLVDFCRHDLRPQRAVSQDAGREEKPILFGEKEGRIALANRRKDPLYLFSALQRHLGYPTVPRPRAKRTPSVSSSRRSSQVERLEMRIKLLEEDLRGGINLNRFYGPQGEQKKVE